MNQHFKAPVAIDPDDVISVHDMLSEAITMGDITAMLVSEQFDDTMLKETTGAGGPLSFSVSRIRADHMVFCVCDTYRRLKQIEKVFSETLASKV
jgi:hypothetical protein